MVLFLCTISVLEEQRIKETSESKILKKEKVSATKGKTPQERIYSMQLMCLNQCNVRRRILDWTQDPHIRKHSYWLYHNTGQLFLWSWVMVSLAHCS